MYTRPPMVLVAEADPETRSLIRDWLIGRGCRVAAVSTGAELVERLAQAWLDGKPWHQPDVIVWDLHTAASAWRFAFRTLRGQDAGIPLMLLTGVSDPHLSAEARVGADFAVLAPPIDRERLLDAIERTTGRAPRPWRPA